ncbi:hypothetical protein F9L33_07250 [Amylibacter sp. SFDW26]|uniref:hypothetical protein n=1 Tax=Amylibacter sp. SFDW26 TaxID=2652722 RepID=UPI0012627149|nr:hypothetical protein [Amylibacter sp. SFDW26]KAB7614433.1 hypothetical protein F9L33_07250 [Amylibacter sp. SFDW26]
MAMEALKASILLLLEEMTEQPEDYHQLQEQLREKISEYKSLGLPVADEIIRAEELLSENKGQSNGKDK